MRIKNMLSQSQYLSTLTCLPHFGQTTSRIGLSLLSGNIMDIHVRSTYFVVPVNKILANFRASLTIIFLS